MRAGIFKAVFLLAFPLLILCGHAQAQGPTITGMEPTSGTLGAPVRIAGTGFGTTQSGSTISLNGTSAAILSWSDTTIVVLVPSGATSGPFSVTVNSQTATSSSFTVIPLPSGWSDGDVGTVGVAGSATYSNGVFTVKGAGSQIYGSADSFNFVYQSLSGDGTIVARIVSVQGGNSYAAAGVMIRETLTAGSANAKTADWPAYSGIYFDVRTTTGGSTLEPGSVGATLPYWVKIVRSGSTFSAYTSSDGFTWSQRGSSQTITMAQNVYIGLAVTSANTSALATATFDNLTVTSSSNTAPVITGLSATTGSVGSQVVISGTGFGASMGNSVVRLNSAPMLATSWSDTSITITIPTGATSGPLAVSLAPGMNDSNCVHFAVTPYPLPTGWLDEEVSPAGTPGTATYTNGAFTLSTSGEWVYGTSDGMHFVYQPLSGDGSIVARVVSGSGPLAQAGVMIRQTLDASSASAYMAYDQSNVYFFDRPSNGANTSQNGTGSASLPYWVKLVRSGNVFTGYVSPDGVNWTQISSQTITMTTNVYTGLAVSATSTSSLATATFDNVSVNSAAVPAPVITGVSATTGSVGSQVAISGSGFGTSVGSSLVTLNATPVTINFWSDTFITITIPTAATSGPLLVSVAPTMNESNYVIFTVTSQPLPEGWLDEDVNPAGAAGSATYTSGAFTLSTSGEWIYGTADGMHFVYQPLSGDGSIVARVVSGSGPLAQAGVMIRQTLDASSASAYTAYDQSYFYQFNRTSSGGSTSQQNGTAATLPYWVKLVRSGSIFTGYVSPNGSTWTQVASQTITMTTNVYIGLAVSATSTSSLATATFDNVTVTAGTMPHITSISPSSGGLATSVTIVGASFGSTQGSTTLTFNGTSPASITSWSDIQIVATVPNSVTTGPVVVTVNSNASNSDVTFIAINPVITSLSPPAAEVGAQVTLNGYNFGAVQGSSYVQFNGVTISGVVSWSDLAITVNIPSNITSGPVTVTEGGVTSNGVQFTLTGQLSVTGVSPISGPVGSSVTITGANFGASQSNSTVSFDGVNATSISSWSNTSIVATVPTGASSGPVTVTVGGITVYGPSFQVNATVTLTDSLSHSSTYTSVIAGGKWYVSNSTGSGCSSCTVRGTVSSTFDDLGNTLSATDELGYVTSNAYDSNNNVTSTQQPAVGGTNPTTTYTYNSFGEVLTMTDPLGHVTTNTYDSHGNLTSVTTPAPGGGASASVTSFTYNSLGELTQITDPLNHVTTMTYTSAGLIYTITDPQSNVTTYAYDSRGNRTSITDPQSHVTTFAYDSGNRLTTTTYPDSTTTVFAYDYRGRRTSVTDQNSKTTTYAYDDADRLTSVTDPASHVTYYTYDTENNLTGIEDANSHTTSFTYDAFGRVTETNFPSTHIETYAYDADNNLTSKTDRKSQTINYVYDALNRLSSKTYPDTTTAAYTYDLVGKVTQVVDPTGTYGFSYDNMGRLTGTSTAYSFLTGTFTNAYTYDAASNRTGYTAPDSSTNTYSYDTLNRLTTLANSWAGSFGFSYDSLSRRTQITRPNSVTTNYTYDSLSRLLTVLHQSGGSTIDGASYTLDSAGNRTAKVDQHASVTSDYTYDALYELTQATQGGTTTESYSYDPVGNRTASLGVSSYTTNSSNEMTANSNASYTYDNNGNTLTKTVGSNTTSYTWDFENRMTSVTLPGSGGTVSFKYDPFDRRVQKVFTTGTTTTTNYLYDGDNDIEELNASGTILARYTQTQNVDEPLAESRSSTTSFYEADGLGSITSLTNGSGTIANSYTYDSFGNLTASSGSVTNPFQYTGRDFDPETGLRYYRARYYDPPSGHFISEDPIKFMGGIDFYGYVGNSPLIHLDPSGLWSPAAHDQIIWNALHPCGVSDADIWQIQQGSRFADGSPFQDPQYSFMHAMSNGTAGQSPSAAQSQAASFIGAEMQAATNQMNAGASSQALFTFGIAMHPVMDVTSPAHTDQNGNPIPWCGMNPFSCSNLSQHIWPTSIEDLDHLNADPGVQQDENFVIRSWYEALTGKTLKCCSK